MTQEGIVCPVCKNNDLLVLYQTTSHDAAAQFFDPFRQNSKYQTLKAITEKLWDTDHGFFYRCNRCGLGFAVPLVAGSKEFYKLAYGTPSYSGLTWGHRLTIEYFKRNVPIDALKALEVGAGNGHFMKMLVKQLGSIDTILCTEFSEFGLAALSEYGINAVAKEMTEIAEEYQASFNCVFMFQVLEHMANIEEVFGCLSKLITDDAHIFISVPSARLRAFYDRMGIHLDIPPTHVTRWDISAFEIMAERFDLVIKNYWVQKEVFFSKARKYLFETYGYKRRTPNSVYGTIGLMSNKPLRRILHGVCFLLHSARSLPVLWKMVKSDLGTSMLVHLTRKSSTQLL